MWMLEKCKTNINCQCRKDSRAISLCEVKNYAKAGRFCFCSSIITIQVSTKYIKKVRNICI